jgi:hypothetical protein
MAYSSSKFHFLQKGSLKSQVSERGAGEVEVPKMWKEGVTAAEAPKAG